MIRILSICLALFVLATAARAEIRAVEPDPPESLPAFTLSDAGGKAFTHKDFEGRWSLILIGFTNCPDVCPFVLSNLAEVVEQISLRVHPDSLPRVVFVGIDPKRDAAVIGDYVAHFGPNFVGVTGEPVELAKLVEGIDGFYRLGKPDGDGNYEVQHSASVIVTGPDGRIHAKLSPPLEPAEVAQYLARKRIAFNRQRRN